jgi:ubiquinone/menaquinone biosynthesis C-methylase UbiE
MTNQDKNKCCVVDIEKCDILEFMANVVGLTVLHPGGFKGTNELADLCKIGKDTQVLDIACGKGTSACYLSKKFGCRVTGIDIDENLINQAKKLAKKKKLENKLTFKVANAENLPFSDDEFDVSIFQAVLVLVNDKEKAIREAIRVTKPGGYIGVLELSWQKQPSKEFFEEAVENICAVCMRNVQTYEGWRNLIFNTDLKEVKTKTYEMFTAESSSMMRDEGFSTKMKVMSKWMFNSRIRRRMSLIFNFFKRNAEYFGYGIYVGQKPR